MLLIVRAARLWRPIFLILAGVLVGATFVAPVAARVTGPGGTPAITTYTRSASCAGLDFYPTDSETLYSTFGTARTHPDLGSGIFRCDPGLPNGAVVTKVHRDTR
jgi:hypothetical protein